MSEKFLKIGYLLIEFIFTADKNEPKPDVDEAGLLLRSELGRGRNLILNKG